MGKSVIVGHITSLYFTMELLLICKSQLAHTLNLLIDTDNHKLTRSIDATKRSHYLFGVTKLNAL